MTYDSLVEALNQIQAELRGQRYAMDEAANCLRIMETHIDDWLCRLVRLPTNDYSSLLTPPAPVPASMTAWADNPQAAQIDALIGRAGRLTDAEVDALGAARGAAWGAAWGAALGAARGAARGAAWYAAEGAAWGAARGAARGAAWYAAEGAAWGAAWGAAGDAARYAARGAAGAAADVADALVVRDLIDEATPWNQAAYDLLVAPWVAVFGPAHPDDVQVDR